MQNLFGTALMLCLLLLTPALAEPTAPAGSVGQTLTEFGFMGSWAQDCDRPPAIDNVWREASPTGDGGVLFTESLGENFKPSAYRVLTAHRKSSDTVVLSIELNGTIHQDLTMVLRDERIRTMVNRPKDSKEAMVENGVIRANGLATPWLKHCEKQRLRA